MAERFKEHGKQTSQKPDIADMIAKASSSIRARAGQPTSGPDGYARALDPQIYAAETPAARAKQKPRTASPRQEVTYQQPQPLLPREVIEELDKIFRVRETTPVPQPAPSPQQTLAPAPVVAEQPIVIAQSTAEVSQGRPVDMKLAIPAPGTDESIIFEYELRKAQDIIARAEKGGYTPQLLIDDFSPPVIAFLEACGQGPYLVTQLHPRTTSIAGLVSQATLAARQSGDQRATNQALGSEERHRMSPRMRKLLVGAVATVATSFGLFTGSYVFARETMCKPTDLGAKLACTALALNANAIDGIPLVNTFSAIWRSPIEIYDKLVGHPDGSTTEEPNGVKR